VAGPAASVGAAPAAKGPEALRMCSPSQLSVSARAGGAGLGHESEVVLFKNRSTSTCSLIGYPAVVGVTAHGKKSARAKSTLTGYLGGLGAGARLTGIVLAPGQYVAALVEGGSNQVGTTACAYYPSLLVTVPGARSQSKVKVVGYGGAKGGLPGCARLEVHPFVSSLTGSTVPAITSSAGACTNGVLTAQYRGSQGAAGNVASGFWVVNTGPTPCELSGTVSVELLNGHGASRTASNGVNPPILLSANGTMPAPGSNPAKGSTLASIVLFWPTIANAVQSLGESGVTCPQPLFQATSAHITFSGLQPLIVTGLTTSEPAPTAIPSMCGSDMSVTAVSPLTAP